VVVRELQAVATVVWSVVEVAAADAAEEATAGAASVWATQPSPPLHLPLAEECHR
jgi:hypothetical protein